MRQSELAVVYFLSSMRKHDPKVFRILGHDHELIYDWQAGQADEDDQGQPHH
jgi:hypothetical protein